MSEVPVSWVTLFVLVSYLMGVACLCLAFRIGSAGGWRRGLREVGLLLFFCGLGYTVESWAHARTPYYYYDEAFPDRVSRIRFDRQSWFWQPRQTECLTYVNAHMPKEREIPLSIPILEGSLAFAALWTSRFLGGPVWLRPLLAGLALVTIDALIDPIVASTFDCHGGLVRRGLGFWRWYVDPDSIARWYGIPIFNFIGWYAAAVLLVSLAYLIGWGSGIGRWAAPKFIRGMSPAEAPTPHGALWLLAVAAPASVFWVSPSRAEPITPTLQWVIILALIGGTAAAVYKYAPRFGTAWDEVGDLTRAFSLPLLFGGFALLVSGQFMGSPTFLVAALALGGAGALLTFWPYQESVCRHAIRLVDVDRFVRLHYVGYPWMLVLLGAAFAANAKLTAGRVGALLGVAAAFHIYSCVLNDVIDLDMDRTQVRRRNDPLVRGAIDRTTAHVFALIQLPVIALLSFLARGESGPLVLMAIACMLMGAYNRWGKLCPFPPLTDLAQGIAWGILALYGASVAGGISTIPWVVFAYGAGFMWMINGIHGGLRDLANDVACGRTNTARLLGAEPDPHDPYRTRSTLGVALFAFTIQTAMLAMLAWVLYRNELPYYLPLSADPLDRAGELYPFVRAVVITMFLVVAVWCHVLLWRLVRSGWARRDEAGSMHAFAILLQLVIVFTPALKRDLQVILPLCFFVPLLVQFVDPIVGSVFPALRGRVAR